MELEMEMQVRVPRRQILILPLCLRGRMISIIGLTEISGEEGGTRMAWMVLECLFDMLVGIYSLWEIWLQRAKGYKWGGTFSLYV